MLRTFDRDAQQLKNIRHLNPLSADSCRVTPAFMQPFAPPFQVSELSKSY
jgi:hypothetical protein